MNYIPPVKSNATTEANNTLGKGSLFAVLVPTLIVPLLGICLLLYECAKRIHRKHQSKKKRRERRARRRRSGGGDGDDDDGNDASEVGDETNLSNSWFIFSHLVRPAPPAHLKDDATLVEVPPIVPESDLESAETKVDYRR
ncbi:uncharacterized protein LODBEIA_P04000 [Lodderomyces beijingensis]|uniref:Uncharacterized protein n=1 Tax=Lodderomyces beijingensis TaxID=1775926 RepID=A0ABP0ZDD3_9ASCO